MNGHAREVVAKIRRLPHAPSELPHYQTEGASGMDLCLAGDDVTVTPGERVLLPTGFAVAVPPGYEAQVRARSGLALRTGLIVGNAPGTVDSDYRGEVMVLLLNAGREKVVVKRGERLAQLVVAPVARCVWQEVAELPVSPRGSGGFGSTGVR